MSGGAGGARAGIAKTTGTVIPAFASAHGPHWRARFRGPRQLQRQIFFGFGLAILAAMLVSLAVFGLVSRGGRTRRVVVGAAVVCCSSPATCCGSLSGMAARRIARPLRELARVASELGAGKLESRVQLAAPRPGRDRRARRTRSTTWLRASRPRSRANRSCSAPPRTSCARRWRACACCSRCCRKRCRRSARGQARTRGRGHGCARRRAARGRARRGRRAGQAHARHRRHRARMRRARGLRESTSRSATARAACTPTPRCSRARSRSCSTTRASTAARTCACARGAKARTSRSASRTTAAASTPPICRACSSRSRAGTARRRTSARASGLGLYLVRRIARAHGGEAFAENRAEGGARLRFTLAGSDTAPALRGGA